MNPWPSIWRFGMVAASICFMIAALKSSAQENGIYINEIMWAGEEYIELHNPTTTAISISGWKVSEQRTSDTPEQTLFEFAEDLQIAPRGYFLVERIEDATSIAADYVVDFRLVNTGTMLRLYNDDGVVADQMGRFSSWQAGSSRDGGISMERKGHMDEWFSASTSLGDRKGSPGTSSNVISEELASPSPSSEPSPAISQAPVQLRIEEFLPNPTGSDTENEFIEIRNIGSAATSIEGWQIDDAEGGSKPYVIPSGTIVQPGELKVFWIKDTKISLNNNIDQVRILDPAGSEFSRTSYQNAPEGISYVFYSGDEYKLTTQPTPGNNNVVSEPKIVDAKNSPTPSVQANTVGVTSKKVYIYEVLANPEGPDEEGEFIEIMNTDTVRVSLAGWRLDDAEGGSKPYAFPDTAVIEPGGWLVIYRTESKLALNNGPDEVRLFDPNGLLVASFSYTEASEGASYNRMNNGKYVISSTLTPGKPNIITVQGQVAGITSQPIPISQARSMTVDSSVAIKGIITAPPELLGKGISYIQDETGGIQLYLSKEAYPSLKVGDEVQVVGTRSSAGGEERLKIESAKNITYLNARALPEATHILSGKIDETAEGQLIEIQATVTRSSGSTFYVDDGSGETRIVIQESTGIDKPETRKGTLVRAQGIVSQTRSGYRILPRFIEDIVVGEQDIISSHGSAAETSKSDIPLTTAQGSVAAATTVQPSKTTELFSPDTDMQVQPEEPSSVVQRLSQNRKGVALAGIGIAALQVIRGAMTGEPVWKRKSKKLGDSKLKSR